MTVASFFNTTTYVARNRPSGAVSRTGNVSETGIARNRGGNVSKNKKQTPLLQALAFRVLDQPTSSSCSEQNWSTYSFVNSLRRNKLTPKRAEDLVFVHNNLRLLSRSTEQYLDKKTKMWDVGGDEFGIMEDTGFLELAQLSLDEPELENVFFSQNTN
ncbi:hypothetical protein Tco_0003043 [Tanacetum coccineum]